MLRTRKLSVTLLVAMSLWFAGGNTRDADASVSIFAFFGAICVTVYELRGSEDVRPGEQLSDHLAETVVPRLQADAKTRNKFLRVYGRANCIKPDESSFKQQMQLTLYVNRQSADVDGRMLNIVIVAGTTQNACGPLCAYSMAPIVLTSREPIEDARVEAALVDFTKRNVLSHIRD